MSHPSFAPATAEYRPPAHVHPQHSPLPSIAPPSLVIARLNPRASANWFPPWVADMTEVMSPQPFLAVRIFGAHFARPRSSSSEPLGLHFHTSYLLPIWSTGPLDLDSGGYFKIGGTSDDTTAGDVLRIDPPVKYGDGSHPQLYVHAYPYLRVRHTAGDEDFDPLPAGDQIGPHLFEPSSFKRLCQVINETTGSYIAAKSEIALQDRSSGGEEDVGDNWSTFSGPVDGYIEDPLGCVYDFLPFHDLNRLRLGMRSNSAYDPLTVYYQFTKDYTLNLDLRSRTMSWVINARRLFTHRAIVSSSSDQAVSLSATDWEKSHGQRDRQDDWDEDEWAEDDWDDSSLDCIYIDDPKPPIPLTRAKVIALDLFDVVFDREAAIKLALTRLLPIAQRSQDVSPLVRRYLECEALAIQAAPFAPYTDIARNTLQAICRLAGVSADSIGLERALKDLLQPLLHPDALQSLVCLKTAGFTLIGLCRIDQKTFQDHFSASVPAVVQETLCSDTCSPFCMMSSKFILGLVPLAQSLHPGIKNSEIILTTTSPHVSLVPAYDAGLPSVLVSRPTSTVLDSGFRISMPSLTLEGLSSLTSLLENPESRVEPMDIDQRPTSFLFSDFWHYRFPLGRGSFASVFAGSNIITGESIAIKIENSQSRAKQKEVLPYEAMVYRRLQGHPGIPSDHWFGCIDTCNVLVLDRLGPNLQDILYICRGRFSLKTISMLALQMLNRVEFVHSRGLILRDIKPENFAMGLDEDNVSTVYLFDFGLAKLFEHPVTHEHIPYRVNRDGMGTPRYCSYNMDLGRDQSRRDDLEALGNTLLFFYHGRLPWQGIHAPNVSWKYRRIGEMKEGRPFYELLERSPPEFTAYFDHVRGLAYEERADYTLLGSLFERRMKEEHWENDGAFDWIDGQKTERGTLLPGEYKFDLRFAQPLDERPTFFM
ncbi:kinase-like domain-containing protein [Amylostereum chailletii]|nr:kinase-like domain-containing protein [Amylostereum chailletii]